MQFDTNLTFLLCRFRLANGIRACHLIKILLFVLCQGGPGSVCEAVKYAIGLGYRSVDCAYVYETEKEVGEGIQAKVDDGTIKDKSEIFITTKVITNIKKTTNYDRHQVEEWFEDTKGVTRIRKSKDKKTNNDLQNVHIKSMIE